MIGQVSSKVIVLGQQWVEAGRLRPEETVITSMPTYVECEDEEDMVVLDMALALVRNVLYLLSCSKTVSTSSQ